MARHVPWVPAKGFQDDSGIDGKEVIDRPKLRPMQNVLSSKWTNARSLYEEAYGKEESDELFEPIYRAYLESFAEKVEPSVENRSHNESELFWHTSKCSLLPSKHNTMGRQKQSTCNDPRDWIDNH